MRSRAVTAWRVSVFGKFKPRVVHDGKKLLLDSAWAGDEPYMLARSLGDVPVLVHKNRARAGSVAVSDFKADILILDCGQSKASNYELLLISGAVATVGLSRRINARVGPQR